MSLRSGKIVLCLRLLVVLTKDPSSVPSSHMTSHNWQPFLFQVNHHPLLGSVDTAYLQAKYPYTQNKHKINL